MELEVSRDDLRVLSVALERYIENYVDGDDDPRYGHLLRYLEGANAVATWYEVYLYEREDDGEEV